jgi:hypothetical protein
VIGIDTNVLVRYIAQDDPRQSPQATKLIEQDCDSATSGARWAGGSRRTGVAPHSPFTIPDKAFATLTAAGAV